MSSSLSGVDICGDCGADFFANETTGPFCPGCFKKARPVRGEPLGQKHDDGKLRWSLLPLDAVRSIVQVLEYGAQKYSEDSWREIPGAKRRYWDAAIRHLVAWKQGERMDPESTMSHLAHAGCCVLFLLALEIREGVKK